MAWIFVKLNQGPTSRILDFGNGYQMENIYFSLYTPTNLIGGCIAKDHDVSSYMEKDNVVSLKQWYHVAFVLSGTTGKIFANGNQVISGTFPIPDNVVRNNNYIGKSNANGDANAG